MPTHRMPAERDRLDAAAWAELEAGLRAARCSALLAGTETDEFVVQALLLTATNEIGRALARLPRRHVSP